MSPIHVLRHGEPTGPFPEAEIHRQLTRGELTPADYAWREGMADWQPLAEVIALPSVPPPAPLPPSLANQPESRPARKKRRVPPVFTMTGQTGFLEVFPDRLTITPKGGQGLQGHAALSIREIPLPVLIEIGYKLPAFTSGYLQFTVAGSAGGSSKTPADTNTFRFLKTEANIEAAGQITAYVQDRMREARAVPQSALPSASAPANLSEELGRLAALRDQGVLTNAEFQAAKQRLLA